VVGLCMYSEGKATFVNALNERDRSRHTLTHTHTHRIKNDFKVFCYGLGFFVCFPLYFVLSSEQLEDRRGH